MQTNLRIAGDAKQDSSHMKIIATLTMVFLPATFVSVCSSSPTQSEP